MFVFNILEIKGMEFLWVTHILKSKIEQVSLFSTKWWGHMIFQNLLNGTKSLNCSLYLGVCIMDSAIRLENHCEVLLPYHLFFFLCWINIRHLSLLVYLYSFGGYSSVWLKCSWKPQLVFVCWRQRTCPYQYKIFLFVCFFFLRLNCPFLP